MKDGIEPAGFAFIEKKPKRLQRVLENGTNHLPCG
jgi:hypothetical protein